jgi:hypothetical protein
MDEPPPQGLWAGRAYVIRGLTITARAPWLYVAITVAYSLPALLAAWLVFSLNQPEPWQNVAIFSLPWMTLVLGTVVVMMAVGAHAHGHDLTLSRATWRALPHVPRYVWTNAHTSLIFWIPIGSLLSALEWLAERPPFAAIGASIIETGSLIFIAPLAIYLHTRTLLAPFLAIHADLPATLATIEAWRLSQRALLTCMSTLLAGSLPIALPLGVVVLGVLAALPGDVRMALEPALPDLAYAGIQIVRPLLIPATYLMFVDLWAAERQRRAQVGAPATPAWARALLAVTRPMPHLTPRS